MAPELVTLEEIRRTAEYLHQTKLIVRTPLVNFQPRCPFFQSSSTTTSPNVYLKLESLQTVGSFKIRGVVNQMRFLPQDVKGCVTMSGGNYGRAFAFATAEKKIPSIVCMPDTVAKSRSDIIEGYGTQVQRTTTPNLDNLVLSIVKEKNYHYLHPFDDLHLIRGYGSIGLEILQDLPDVDVVIVSCGGGGLLSGVSAAIKLSNSKARIIAVEPEGAPKFHLSLKAGEPIKLKESKTIASGLAPPYAGKITFQHFKSFVDELVLVSDEEIKNALKLMYSAGLVVEPSGAATLAALVSKKVKNIEGKKVVCIVSGSNISPMEMANL